MEDFRKVAIYSRKSKFTGKGESIENQIELCRKCIQGTFENIPDDDILIFEDEGFSGGNTNRPQFQKMLKLCREKQIKCIVCYRLDRISRNVSDYSNLITELNKLDISFISVTEKFDTTSNMGRAMMYIASVFAQLERETIAERIRDNMLELAKDGLEEIRRQAIKALKQSEVLQSTEEKEKQESLKSFPKKRRL